MDTKAKGIESNKSKLDKMWAMKEEDKDEAHASSFGIKEEFPIPSLIRFRIGVRKARELSPAQLFKCGNKPAFTPAQLDELEQQTLIYRHLVAGLPVLHDFVLPVWKSVASSLGLSDEGMYELYPSFSGFNPPDFYNSFMMDAEPGRCRRTDGKKWRCTKDVVADRKYCERHLHRGRYGSRKLVETSETGTSPILPSPKIESYDSLNTKLSISFSAPLSSPCRSPPNDSNTCNKRGTSITISAVDVKAMSGSGAKEGSYESVGNSKCFFSTATATTSKKIKIEEEFDDETNYGNHLVLCSNVNKIRNCQNNTVSNSLYAGLRFSPEAVIQVLGSNNSCFNHKSYMDPEPGRCRRTDGKKWQCKNDVVAGQKYCIRHMHRGAKRHAGAFLTEFTTGSPATINKRDAFLDIDTKLSIGIPENLQVNINEEKSSSSSTISDTISTATTPGQSSTSRMFSASP